LHLKLYLKGTLLPESLFEGMLVGATIVLVLIALGIRTIFNWVTLKQYANGKYLNHFTALFWSDVVIAGMAILVASLCATVALSIPVRQPVVYWALFIVPLLVACVGYVLMLRRLLEGPKRLFRKLRVTGFRDNGTPTGPIRQARSLDKIEVSNPDSD
jgi:hypothetical protein